MAEADALAGAKFGSDLYVNDFPVKLRVLTVDPMVYNDNFGNTKYAFVVFNIELQKVQILDKGPGIAARLQAIHQDLDFGGDIRKIDLKITTNGKSGIEIRYTITPIGSPGELPEEDKKIVIDSKIDLEAIVKKNNPGAIRLSEINAGKKPGPAVKDMPVEPSNTVRDPVIEDIKEDEPINLDDIPF